MKCRVHWPIDTRSLCLFHPQSRNWISLKYANFLSRGQGAGLEEVGRGEFRGQRDGSDV